MDKTRLILKQNEFEVLEMFFMQSKMEILFDEQFGKTLKFPGRENYVSCDKGIDFSRIDISEGTKLIPTDEMKK